MFVVIVGGGKVGSHLAKLLMEEGHEVRIIEPREDVLTKLHRELPAEVIHDGDGTDPAPGSERHPPRPGLGSRDRQRRDQPGCRQPGRFEFNVPRIIGRVNNPRNQWLFTAEMGVDVAINQADIMAKLLVEEMSLGDMMTLLKLRKGEIELVEEKIHETSVVNGKAIKDIQWPDQCTLAAVIRKGDVIAPNGNTVLQAFDEVLAVLRTSQRMQLAKLLGRA